MTILVGILQGYQTLPIVERPEVDVNIPIPIDGNMPGPAKLIGKNRGRESSWEY